MQLVINTEGSYLRKKDNLFLIKNEDRVFEVSAKKVDSILITTAATISTDAIKFAVENNIDIVFLDYHGNPFGRVWHAKMGSTAMIRRRQLEVSEVEDGLVLAKDWVIRKLDNQMNFLNELASNRPKKTDEISEYSGKFKVLKEKIISVEGTIGEKRGTIMGIEGAAGRSYFEALSMIMPDRFRFKGRSRNPAKDEFNCLLNYGYGVLYSMVEKACIIAGLDPFIGFIHVDNYNKKSLVFDLIEMYRIFAEKTVVFLFSGRKVKKEQFDKIRGGLSLNKEGKALLIEALNGLFDERVRYGGRNIKNRDTIQFECHRIANGLIKDVG